jgi:hypothetical protein
MCMCVCVKMCKFFNTSVRITLKESEVCVLILQNFKSKFALIRSVLLQIAIFFSMFFFIRVFFILFALQILTAGAVQIVRRYLPWLPDDGIYTPEEHVSEFHSCVVQFLMEAVQIAMGDFPWLPYNKICTPEELLLTFFLPLLSSSLNSSSKSTRNHTKPPRSTTCASPTSRPLWPECPFSTSNTPGRARPSLA